MATAFSLAEDILFAHKGYAEGDEVHALARRIQADIDAAVAAERAKCLMDIDASEGDIDYAKHLIRARGAKPGDDK